MSEVKLPVMDPRVPNLRQTKQNKTKQDHQRSSEDIETPRLLFILSI